MDIRTKLKAYVGDLVVVKDKIFTLESVEEDHLVLLDEDHLHAFIQLTAIRDFKEVSDQNPEIVLLK